MCRSRLSQLVLGGAAFLTLGCGGSRVDELSTQLANGDVQVRRAAARSLKELSGDKVRAIPALTDAASQDDDLEVRRLSIQALGEIGPPAEASISVLLQTLEDSPEAVQVAAALAIARIAPERESYQPVLIRAMRAGNGGVLMAVGRLGEDAKWAVPTLVELLTHELVQIRSLAAHTLGQIGPAAKDAAPALERMSRDSDPAVREVALQALESVRTAQSNSEQEIHK